MTDAYHMAGEMEGAVSQMAVYPFQLPQTDSQPKTTMNAWAWDPRRSIGKIEGQLGHFFANLTDRERAVCARTMVGMTAEAIGLDLGIAASSVLTYRRRAYERYRFTNINQFFLGMI